MSTVTDDMLIDAVDGTDSPIGTVKRREVFSARANFRVAHVLVFNSNQELLLQRLALSRERHAGFWGSSVAAYLYSHETYAAAATRRIEEELGIVRPHLEALGKTTMLDEGCQKFIGIFKAVADGPFNYDHAHIDRLEFLPVPVISKLITTRGRPFTPTFVRVFGFYERSHSVATQ
jgi:hypothetical protein